MNKALLRVLLPLLLLSALLAFTLALSPLTTSSAHVPAIGRGHDQGPTPTPTPEDRSVPGSTDGIIVMSFAIVAIILLPLLLHRAFWMR